MPVSTPVPTTVAITGATGGLGRSTLEFLLKQGYQVTALGRNEATGGELRALGAKFLAGSITDVAYLTGALEGCDAVIHCAGLASPFGEWSAFEDANVHGTAAVLQAAQKTSHPIRTFIHISTPSVYFNGRDAENVRETYLPQKQLSFYSRSKHIADELVLADAARFTDQSFVLLRPRAIIGPYDQTIIPRMLKILRKGVFPLPQGGRALIDLTAAINVAHAIDLVLKSPTVFHGEIFNITNEEPQPVRDLVLRLARAIGVKPRLISIPMFVLKPLTALSEAFARGREPIISKYSVESIGTTQTLSTEKARRLLGYKPIVSLEDALSEVVKKLH